MRVGIEAPREIVVDRIQNLPIPPATEQTLPEPPGTLEEFIAPLAYHMTRSKRVR